MLGGVHPDSSRSSALGHSAGDALAMKGIMTTTRSNLGREAAAAGAGSKPQRPEQMGAGARPSRSHDGISSSQVSVDPKVAERAERTRVREAEELAYALKTRVGAKNAFGGNEPMRLSVAHNLQPALSKARGEAERLRAEKNLLLRHNRHLLLEISRLQSVAAQRATTPQQAMFASGGTAALVAAAMEGEDEASAAGGGGAAGVGGTAAAPEPGPFATSGGVADVLSWPPTGADTVQLRRQHDELKNEHRAQAAELRAAQRLNRELLDKAATVEEQAKAVNALRDELMPLIAATKKEAAEDRIWNDATKLTAAAHLAIRSGVPEHRVAHMITRAKQLEIGDGVHRSPRPHSAYAAGSPMGSPAAQVWSVGRDDAHVSLHDGMGFVTGTSRTLREPHKGGSGQFGSRGGGKGGKHGAASSPGSPRRGQLGNRDQRGGAKGTKIDFFETRGSASSGTFYPDVSAAAGLGPSLGGDGDSAARLRAEVSASRLGTSERRGEGANGGHEGYASVRLDFSSESGVLCKVVATSS